MLELVSSISQPFILFSILRQMLLVLNINVFLMTLLVLFGQIVSLIHLYENILCNELTVIFVVEFSFSGYVALLTDFVSLAPDIPAHDHFNSQTPTAQQPPTQVHPTSPGTTTIPTSTQPQSTSILIR